MPDRTSLATPGVQMTNPFLYASLSYDAEKDFTPIIYLAHPPRRKMAAIPRLERKV